MNARLHALLATSRVANVPSVVSNVWLGVALGVMLGMANSGDSVRVFPWAAVWKLMASGICLYVGGNFLNDWMDRKWDGQHRPERALPSGLFHPVVYLNAAIAFLIAGICFANSVNKLAAAAAAAIVLCILIYTVWHKRAAWSVVPMGLCRALLPMMGVVGVMKDSVITPHAMMILLTAGLCAAGLFLHIVGLSVSARRESTKGEVEDSTDGSRFIFALAVVLMLAAGFRSGIPWWFLCAGAVPYVAWFGVCRTLHRRPIGRYVSSLLAGIPLLDWVILLPASIVLVSSGLTWWDPIKVGGFLIPPLAFLSALLLQKLAPAT